MSAFPAALSGIALGVAPGLALGWVAALLLSLDIESAMLAVWIGGAVGAIAGAVLMVRWSLKDRVPARPPFGGSK